MYWVKVPVTRGDITRHDYPCKTWEEALQKAEELAKFVNQGVWIEVYTPCNTLIARVMGMC